MKEKIHKILHEHYLKKGFYRPSLKMGNTYIHGEEFLEINALVDACNKLEYNARQKLLEERKKQTLSTLKRKGWDIIQVLHPGRINDQTKYKRYIPPLWRGMYNENI